MANCIKVLHVTPSLNRSSGVATFVRNMHAACGDDFRFDYLHQAVGNDKAPLYANTYDAELRGLGASVYHVVSPAKDFRKFVRQIASFFDAHGSEYDIIHCHVPNVAFCVLRDAGRVGVKHRLLHSHLNTSSEHLLHRIRNKPLIAVGKRYATTFVACSEEAGDYLFSGQPYTLIRNGILIDKFVFDESKRKEKRISFGIGLDSPVIGCVGRIAKQKNHTFAIDIFSKLLTRASDVTLLIVGDGEGRDELEHKIADMGLADRVILAGNRNDIAKLYSLMDVFLMPSLCEGLPFSAVEAQAAGLPCIYSTGVPKETDITGTGTFIPLEESVDAWANAIIEALCRGRAEGNAQALETSGYSVSSASSSLAELYHLQMSGDVKC